MGGYRSVGRVLILQDEEVLEIYCIKMRVYLTLLNGKNGQDGKF